MISKWTYLPLTTKELKIENELAKAYANCPAISELLIQRGITTIAEAEKFFHPKMSDIHDPFLMKDMDKAVGRLNKAMGTKEKILIYGDYDVDGTTAVSLVYRFLQNYYSNIEYYIPDRYDEGYGISKKSIDNAAESGVTLIIVLDCGIKAVEEVAYAKQCGIDFIICDHHVPDNDLPDAVAILNPKLESDSYPYKHLSGCGVGYKFMHGFAISNNLNIANDLEPLLDLVAVSIAADIVPITGENRVMAYYGLKRINSNPNMGLRSIIKICALNTKEITISDVIFKIGPRINASGRMQQGKEAVDLLVAKDYAEAMIKGQNIDQYNKDRKELDKRVTEEANQILAERGNVDDLKSIVIYNKNWHKGIIGIVASRLTELYYKPAVVLTLSNGLATGSSRSVQGFDIYSAIESCRDIIENFGGHTYAVGLSLKVENLPEFTRRFEEYIATNITTTQMTPQIDIDAVLKFSDITHTFTTLLKQFNPFGPGNLKPIFCTKNVYDFGTSKLVGKNLEHIKLELVDSESGKVLNGIAFNMAKHFEYIKSKKPFDICYTIEQNSHRVNTNQIQLFVKEIRVSNK